jgi:hypothetical protein
LFALNVDAKYKKGEREMAEKQQEYPDVVLAIDRDDNGNITRVEYTVNNEGEDKIRILEFLSALNSLMSQAIPEPTTTENK